MRLGSFVTLVLTGASCPLTALKLGGSDHYHVSLSVPSCEGGTLVTTVTFESMNPVPNRLPWGKKMCEASYSVFSKDQPGSNSFPAIEKNIERL